MHTFLFLQEQNYELKKKESKDNVLLKKSSLDIPLLAERDEDKKMASLLSMKLVSSKSVAQNTDLMRKNILLESSLPTTSFCRSKELKAVKVLSKEKQSLGIIPKRLLKDNVAQECKKPKLITSLVEDYGSSSSSE